MHYPAEKNRPLKTIVLHSKYHLSKNTEELLIKSNVSKVKNGYYWELTLSKVLQMYSFIFYTHQHETNV